MTDDSSCAIILIILCGGACMSGSDFVSILALLTAMFTVRRLIFKAFPLVHCDSNLQNLSKGFLLGRYYSVIGFHTEQNTRNYLCLFDISFICVYLWIVCCIISYSLPLSHYASGMKFYIVVNFACTVCIMVWHVYKFYQINSKVDKYCVILGIVIVVLLHVLTYYDCIVIKSRIIELDFILNPIITVLAILFLFCISYYPHAIKQDCLFCIHFGIEDDEVRIELKDGNVISSIEKPLIPVILDNGDILVYSIAEERKNLDKVVKAEEVVRFRYVDREFVFNANIRRWYEKILKLQQK